MKLLFVVKTLGLTGGGAERVLAEITAGLAARGHEVTVASFDAPGAADFYAFDHRVVRIRMGIGRSDRPSGMVDVLRRAVRLRRLLRAERPDVAIGFMHSAYVPLALALPGSGVAGVASEHIVHGHYADRPVERALLRLVAPRFRSITAVSEAMRQSFPAPIRRRMEVIPNPVRIAPSDRAPAVGDQRTLLTVGRLESQKDHATLIAAFARLRGDFPDWRLRIVGEGALRPELERQVAGLGLGDCVTLTGATAEIDCEYRAADLFAMPSLYESFGIATAEGLGHGLPAIGFADCPGTNELIVDGENGLLVAGGDRVAALAGGLARLMGSEAERARMGAAGPGAIAAFSAPRIVEQWEALLEAARVAR
jgi:glycosyltransferase involved in cell wall biosynthesis